MFYFYLLQCLYSQVFNYSNCIGHLNGETIYIKLHSKVKWNHKRNDKHNYMPNVHEVKNLD